MNVFKIMTVVVVAVLALSFTAVQAQADPIDLELALVIDGSGSINSTEFALQINGYIAALNSQLVTDGSVAVGVWQFSTSGSNLAQQEFATRVIDSAGDLTDLVSALSGMTQLGNLTYIGTAITAAATDLLTNGITSNRQIIDVSTDGASFDDDDTAADNAVTAGIEQVNGLGIGVDVTFHSGVGSFAIRADNFAGFASAIETKLAREIGGEVPEPSSIVLMGLGVLGFAVYRRRRVA